MGGQFGIYAAPLAYDPGLERSTWHKKPEGGAQPGPVVAVAAADKTTPGDLRADTVPADLAPSSDLGMILPACMGAKPGTIASAQDKPGLSVLAVREYEAYLEQAVTIPAEVRECLIPPDLPGRYAGMAVGEFDGTRQPGTKAALFVLSVLHVTSTATVLGPGPRGPACRWLRYASSNH